MAAQVVGASPSQKIMAEGSRPEDGGRLHDEVLFENKY